MTTYDRGQILRKQKHQCWFCNDDEIYTTGFCVRCFHDKYVVPRRQKNKKLSQKWATIIKKKYILDNLE